MTRTCPTCGSDRCEAAAVHANAGVMMWFIVGVTGSYICRRLQGAPLMDPFALAYRMDPERVREMSAESVLMDIERRLARREDGR